MSGTPRDTTAPSRPRRKIQNGATIRSLREKDGYSQAGLAKAAGMTQANLSRIETEDQAPSLATLNRIARALAVPVVALLRDAGDAGNCAKGDAA
jgi:transcriptional regulator with XRE-family HTH domain